MKTENLLNIEDINILLNAIDCWINNSADGLLLGSLVGSLFTKDSSPAEKIKIQETLADSENKAKAEKLRRQEIAITLKYKILQLKKTGTTLTN